MKRLFNFLIVFFCLAVLSAGVFSAKSASGASVGTGQPVGPIYIAIGVLIASAVVILIAVFLKPKH